MTEYNVVIRETLRRTVAVKAESMSDAKDIAQEGWLNGEFVLDSSDFQGVEFSVQYPRSRDRER